MTYTRHARELTALKQHLDWTDVRDAFAGAYYGVFLRPIRLDPLGILLAQSALESGRWEAGLYNFNFSNIKASLTYIAKPDCFHQYYRLNEYLRQPDGSYKYEWFDPIHPQTRMRAYRNGPDGAAEKVRFLGTASNPARGNRYQKAWDALEDGDPRSYSIELHNAGYYTAQEAPYTRAVVSLFKEYRAKLDASPPISVLINSPPLAAGDYADDQEKHSAVTAVDLERIWRMTTPWEFGLPDDVLGAIQDDKTKAYEELNDKW